MKLEDYFEFENADTPHGKVERIRIKGHRIAIEHVLEFHRQGVSVEDIQRLHYPTLTLDEVKATVQYYEQNRVEVEAYLKRGEEVAEAFYQEWLRTHKPSPLEQKLQKLRAQSPESRQESA